MVHYMEVLTVWNSGIYLNIIDRAEPWENRRDSYQVPVEETNQATMINLRESGAV